VAAAVTTGCGGGSDSGSAPAGGLVVSYEAADPSVSAADVSASAEMFRRRTASVGGARVTETPTGVVLELPGVSKLDPLLLPKQLVGLSFYDWEPNVIGPGGKPSPRDPQVTGGPSAGSPAMGVPLYKAVLRAAARRAVTDEDNAWPGRVYYAISPSTRRAKGPFDSRSRAARHGRVVPVGPGTIIVRAEQPDDIPVPRKSNDWFVLTDDVELDGADIVSPEQNFDQGAGGSGAPIVAFEFAEASRTTWEQFTKRIVRRGRAQRRGRSAQETAQHFAVVLDDEIISVPFIDWVQNPNGIDGSNGSQIEGGFTIRSAQTLASVLTAGPVPVPMRRVSVREQP
jgi:SecD/SecF fusion protein